MSGLLSSAAIMLKYVKGVSGSDSVGGAVNATLKLTGDKKVQLMKADGSMMKVLGNYVVEPIAVVSDDLLDVEELDSILGLHMDMFTGYYMQIFDILLNIYNVDAEVIIDALGTDNGGLTRLLSKGSSNYAKTGNIFSSECDDLHDWVGDLVRNSELEVTDDGQLVNLSVEAHKPNPWDAADRKKFKAYMDATKATINATAARSGMSASAAAMSSAEATRVAEASYRSAIASGKSSAEAVKASADATRVADKAYQAAIASGKSAAVAKKYAEEAIKAASAKSKVGKSSVQRDVVRVPIGMSAAHKDLLVPNAIQRTLSITLERPVETVPETGKVYTRTMVISVLVKLAVIFTSKENIINSIEAKSDEYAFSSRLDDYRAGAISLTDFVFASDLINKYKNKKLKDKDGLLELIQSRELSANSKMLTNDFAGFEKYYNMYLVSPDTKAAIEKSVKAKLSTPNGKDRFLERANGLSVTVVDPDYERIQLMVKDTRGKTQLSFRGAVKKEKAGSDYSEIIKALLANKSPSF